MENQFNEENANNHFFQSTSAKLLMVGLLTLALLIPLFFVQDLITERSGRKKTVQSELSNLWGKDIEFYGPILKIPYKTITETTLTEDITGKQKIQSVETEKIAYFFPNELINNSKIKKNTSLKRGIYNNVVFKANMKFKGNFEMPDFEKLNIKPENIIWSKASLILKTTNSKSIKSNFNLLLNGVKFNLESKTDLDKYYGTLETPIFDHKLIAKDGKINFDFNMEYNGSDSVTFIPIGKTTKVNIESDWESPSFFGMFAAEATTKKISKKGFTADWNVLAINRNFEQQYASLLPKLSEYSFGVKLLEIVDEYQQNERASKYGFLVIALTFLIFFLIQSISKVNIHIFQYTMIGIALIMFYTLLIAITEHSSFSFAYSIAGISVVILISLYSISILKGRKFPVFIGLSLTTLYGFIFVIIQLEDYALLVGSLGVFAILAIVMYCSSTIEWNK